MATSATEPYRFVMVPQPSGFYRQYLVPKSRVRGRTLLSPPPFDKLVAKFRQGHIDYADSLSLVFAVPIDAEEWENYHPLGYLSLPVTDVSGQDSHEFQLGVLSAEAELPWCDEFRSLATTAGAHLPLAAKDDLADFRPDTPFAYWMAAVTRDG